MNITRFTIIKVLSIVCSVLWITQAAYAVQNYSLRIDDRSPQEPNGAVKLTLELSGNLTGSETVTVAGEVISVPSGTHTLSDTDSDSDINDGDQVRVFTFPSEPRKVMIRYIPKSRLAPVGTAINYCANETGVTYPINVPIIWNGPDADGYRMTSYTVASNLNCSQPRRRVKSNAAVLTSVPSGVANYGRHPLDVILVLDKSGSMGSTLPGSTTGESRFERLKTAVSEFVALWEQADQANLPGATVHDLSEDRIGLVLFDGTPHPELFGSDIFKVRGSALPGPGHNWQEIINRVLSSGPGGSTTIAGGALEGYSRWCDDGLVKNDTTLVILTDGYEEQEPYFTETNPRAFLERKVWPFIETGQPNDLKSCTAEVTTNAADYTKLHSLGIPILTVALGTWNSLDADLLDDIATQTAGKSAIAADAPALDAAFTDTLVEALKGNTLSLQTRTQGSISASATMSSPVTTYLDGTVRRAVFVASWQGAQNANAIQLQIKRPNGSVVTPIAQQHGDQWTVHSVDLPTSGPKGQWRATLKRTQSISVAAPYQISVYVVEGKLDWRFRIPKWQLYTGKKIQIETEIVYDGVLVKDLPPGAVKIYMEKPVEAIGNIFREASLGVVPKTWIKTNLKLPIEAEPLSKYMVKLAYLEKTARLRERLKPRLVEKPLVLGERKLGKYITNYNEVTKPGQYRFKVVLDWITPKGERIQRVEYLQRQVGVAVSPISKVNVLKGKVSGEYLVAVTPQDKFGNFAGPGHESAFTIEMKGAGKQVFPITDPKINGSYIIRLSGVPAGVDPNVKISFGDQVVRNSRLSQLGTTVSEDCKRSSFCCKSTR